MNTEGIKAYFKCWWFLPLFLFFVVTLNDKLATFVFHGYFLYDAKRIAQLVLLLWAVLYLLFSISGRRYWLSLYFNLPNLVRISILVAFLLGGFSVVYAPVTKMAILGYCLYFLLLAFAFCVASQRIRHGEIIDKVIIAAILFGIVIYEATFFYAFLRTVMSGGKEITFPGFTNLRFLAQYLGWVLPLVTLPLFFIAEEKKILRTIFYLVAGLLWSIALANASLGLFVSLGVSFLVAGFIYRKSTKSWFKTQAISFLIGIVIYTVLFLILGHLFGFKVHSFIGRLPLWHISITHIIKHPWLGLGPQHFSHYLNGISSHPYNSLLLIGVEWGLIVLAIFLLIFFLGLRGWIKKCDSRTPVHIALTVSLIASSLYSMTSGVIVMPQSQVMLILVVGWMMGFYFKDQQVAIERRLVGEIGLILLLVLAVSGVLLGICPVIYKLSLRELSWAFSHAHKNKFLFSPRFWLQGWF